VYPRQSKDFVVEAGGIHMASRARSPHKSQTESAANALPLEARIRIRAHEIYLERAAARMGTSSTTGCRRSRRSSDPKSEKERTG
jgi:hypothetical protein